MGVNSISRSEGSDRSGTQPHEQLMMICGGDRAPTDCDIIRSTPVPISWHMPHLGYQATVLAFVDSDPSTSPPAGWTQWRTRAAVGLERRPRTDRARGSRRTGGIGAGGSPSPARAIRSISATASSIIGGWGPDRSGATCLDREGTSFGGTMVVVTPERAPSTDHDASNKKPNKRQVGCIRQP